MEVPVKILASPAVIFVLLALLLVMLHQFRASAAKGASVLMLALLWGASSKPVVDQLAAQLELRYPAFANTPVRHILVLGCNHQDSTFLPLSSQLEPCSLARVSEGIRLWHQQPTALLHFSGHIAGKKTEHTEIARRFAIAMGVSPAHIQLHNTAQNTRQEIQTLLAAIGTEPAALVTSAMHMPRAMRWVHFYTNLPLATQKAPTNSPVQTTGLNKTAHTRSQITPAPTDFSIRRHAGSLKPEHFIPSTAAFSALGYVHYEYLGLLLQQWQMAQQHQQLQHDEKLSLPIPE